MRKTREWFVSKKGDLGFRDRESGFLEKSFIAKEKSTLAGRIN